MTALDISTHRVKCLSDEFADDHNVEVLLLDIERESIPHPDNFCDTAIPIDVIEHFVDPIAPLIEIHRVLKPGGHLLIGIPNIAKWTRRIKLLFGHFPATASIEEGLIMFDGNTPVDFFDEGHLHYFTFRSLSRLLRQRIGFSSARYSGWGSWGALCKWWPSLFSDVFMVAVK